ncbi:hypothetical protein [Prochlorothrix hollandica]|uniref:hypothetical protein n=1 Tax=Prochlorothrix hollandica TaxID=1223 RepID=UPI00333EE8D5
MHPTDLRQTAPAPITHIQIPTDPNNVPPGTPVTPPPTSGDSLFWTIVAISILVKTILNQPKGTAK